MKLLLVGGTGLVGSEALKLALAEPRIETLVVESLRGGCRTGRRNEGGHPRANVDDDGLQPRRRRSVEPVRIAKRNTARTEGSNNRS